MGGLYRLTFGYASHTWNFVATREEIEKWKSEVVNVETSKHSVEEVDLSEAKLVTEDEDFIQKFIDLGLVDNNVTLKNEHFLLLSFRTIKAMCK